VIIQYADEVHNGLRHLEELNLASNHIDNEVHNGLRHLEELNLASNHIDNDA